MRSNKMFLKEFGKAFIPEKFFGHPVRANLRKYLLKAGYEKVPYSFFGILFLATAAITYFIFIPFIYPELQGMFFLSIFFLTFLLWAVIQLTLIAIIILIIYYWINGNLYCCNAATSYCISKAITATYISIR